MRNIALGLIELFSGSSATFTIIQDNISWVTDKISKRPDHVLNLQNIILHEVPSLFLLGKKTSFRFLIRVIKLIRMHKHVLEASSSAQFKNILVACSIINIFDLNLSLDVIYTYMYHLIPNIITNKNLSHSWTTKFISSNFDVGCFVRFLRYIQTLNYLFSSNRGLITPLLLE